MNRRSPAVVDALAQAYTMGLLGKRARRRFEAMLRTQPAAADAAAAWQARLARWLEAAPRRSPDPRVRARVETRLFGAPLPDRGAAAPPAPRPAGPMRPRLDAMRAWWQTALGMGCGGGVAAAVLLWQPSLAGLEPAGDALPASYVGVLADAGGRGGLVVSSRRHGRVVNLTLIAPLPVLSAPQVARLWAYPDDGTPPFALGTLPTSGKATVLLPVVSEQVFSQVSRLAVHADLPDPSSPGTLLLSGPCASLW